MCDTQDKIKNVILDENKIRLAFNEIVSRISRSKNNQIDLIGKSGRSIRVSVNRTNIYQLGGASRQSKPDACTLDAVRKLLLEYPTRTSFDSISNINNSLRPGNSTLNWAVLNEMFTIYEYFEISSSYPVNNNEVDKEHKFWEGKQKEVTMLLSSRNRAVRDECIARLGYKCYVCGFDFKAVYGERGHNFIEVHHLKPLAGYAEEYQVCAEDLVPLCSNCHSMVHRTKDVMDVNELKMIIEDRHS